LTRRQDIAAAAKYGYVTFTLLAIASYLFSLPLAVYLLYTSKEGVEYSAASIRPFFMIYMIAFQLPLSIKVGLLFPLLAAVFLTCFLASARSGPSFRSIVDSVNERPLTYFFRNWLFAMPLVANTLLSAVVLLQSFQEAHGVPTGSISFPPNPFVAMISLSYASIVEEIGFRITPLGTVVLLYVLRNLPKGMGPAKMVKTMLISLASPERAKAEVQLPTIESNGLRRGVSIYEWIAVFATSFIFGAAHYIFGGGWDVGKISSAFLAGLVLGLVYVWRGAPASILLHWFFNCYGYIYGVASNYHPALFPSIVDLIDNSVILFTALGLLIITAHVLNYLGGRGGTP